jgi:hypothetical protein
MTNLTKLIMFLLDLFEKRLVTYTIYLDNGKKKMNLPRSLIVTHRIYGFQKLFLRRSEDARKIIINKRYKR